MSSDKYIAQRNDSFTRNFAKAEALLEAGFATKTAQKKAQGYLGQAYSDVRDIVMERVRCTYAPGADHTDEQWSAYVAKLEEYDLPFELHQVRERHIDKAVAFCECEAWAIRALINSRTLVKDEPIKKAEPKQKAVEQEYKERVELSIMELMEKRRTQYEEALDLGREFGGLKVTANVHGVVNQYGTFFIRAFYFLNGRMTPLSVIVAAAQALAREEEESKS